MEAPVKPINKRIKVASSVFGEIERMVGSTQAGFEIAQNRVDPIEFRQIFGLSTARYDRPHRLLRQNTPSHRK